MTKDLIIGPYLVTLISKLKTASTFGINGFPSPLSKKTYIMLKMSSLNSFSPEAYLTYSFLIGYSAGFFA
jgi:hypothetical protein